MTLFDRFLRRRTVPDGPLDCRAVGRVLQQALDGELDDAVADRVAEHLEACLVCGLEAETYLRIKDALLAEGAIDPAAAARLRAFGADLAAGRIEAFDDTDPDADPG